MKIVAELSANHLGSLERAIALVEEAARAGADAVKLQTFTPEQMAEPGIRIETGPWAGRELLELYREAHTPREWHRPLFDVAKINGIDAFSSVFHPDDVEFLETLGCQTYKIASFELTDTALIASAAKTGKPIVISTGMAMEAEMLRGASAAWDAGCTNLTVLKCTSGYPAPVSEMNLATMNDMRRFFSRVGLSDHTLGIAVPVAAVALGATMIEKHLTLSRADGGPDAAFSLEPLEFAEMVRACRDAEAALGKVHYGPTAAEASSVALRRCSGGRRGSLTQTR